MENRYLLHLLLIPFVLFLEYVDIYNYWLCRLRLRNERKLFLRQLIVLQEK